MNRVTQAMKVERTINVAVFRPERGTTNQPRATPGERQTAKSTSPERAAHQLDSAVSNEFDEMPIK